MRPAKLLFSALPLLICGVSLAAQPENPPPADPSANNPGTIEQSVSFSHDADSVTKTAQTTLPDGKTVQEVKTRTKAGDQVNVNATRTGPSGKVAVSNAQWSRANGAVTRTGSTKLPSGKDAALAVQRAKHADIKSQIRAITGPGGQGGTGLSAGKSGQPSITREVLGNIPNVRAINAQIAACGAAGNVSSQIAAASAGAAGGSVAAGPNSAQNTEHPRLESSAPDSSGDNADARTRTIDRTDPAATFLPGQGSQPGAVAPAAAPAGAPGAKSSDPTARSVGAPKLHNGKAHAAARR